MTTIAIARRGRVFIVVIGAALLLFAFWLAIPSSRRLLANPTGQPAQVGVTEVLVRGDLWQNHVYEPSVVRVPVGTTITWTFADRGADGQGEVAPHNVVGAGWASPVIGLGTYQHTFNEAGVYRYVCTLHRNMDGVVEVVAP
jgi:plastocyanin